ncbi:ferritin family protein [Actinomadura sp. NPDC047616]|uniref:ferritin family protein n=1 Tax=Actinomadura sp. NPDC047616 TaxID=3155914 RepID=UPI00340BB3C9
MRLLTTRVLATGAATLTLCAPPGGALAAPLADGPTARTTGRVPKPRTLADLNTSMRGEAFAYASYRLFAAQARREGLRSTARLFDRTARVELAEHFREEAMLSRLARGDAANLRNAIAGESYEHRTMYPRFARQARADGDRAAAALFTEIARDEGGHLRRFRAALRFLQTGRGKVPAPAKVTPERVQAGPPKVRARRTMRNLDTAMHGEALAHAKYMWFAEHARNRAVARLFRGAAAMELREHFAGEARLYGLVRATRANLARAIAGERYESRTMYPRFARRAKAAGDAKAAARFRHNAADEAKHMRAFQRALRRLGRG